MSRYLVNTIGAFNGQKMMQAARLQNSPDFEVVKELIDEGQKEIFTSMKTGRNPDDLLRGQGAGQILDEIIEFLEEAENYAIKMIDK